MSSDFYDAVADDYDRLFDWDRRLEADWQHLEPMLRDHNVRMVLDAACGGGRHVAMLAGKGFTCTGSDASAGMIARARAHTVDCSPPPRLLQCTWAELPERLANVHYGAVLCLGNSLPSVTQRADLQRSLAGLWSRVGRGGFLLIQIKNFERLLRTREPYLPILSWQDGEHDLVCIRQYEYREDLIAFRVLLLDREQGSWRLRPYETTLAPWRAPDLVIPLEQQGARCRLFGTLGNEPFDPRASEDLVVLAERD